MCTSPALKSMTSKQSEIGTRDSKFLWNISKLPPDYTVPHSRRHFSSESLVWEPQTQYDIFLSFYTSSFAIKKQSFSIALAPTDLLTALVLSILSQYYTSFLPLSSILLPWRLTQKVPLKGLRNISTKLHGTIYQKPNLNTYHFEYLKHYTFL
jgi:hypothetical protein